MEQTLTLELVFHILTVLGLGALFGVERSRKQINEKYKMEISFKDEENSLKSLIKKANKEYGGRGILNVIEPKIIDPLADFIFENSENFYPGRKIFISQIANKALFEFVLG